jgi:type II secretory pathway predicted ATPase ExeA
MADILKQICSGFDVAGQTNSLARLTQTIKPAILETANRKQTPVLIIDEASLLRLEVFAQPHTLIWLLIVKWKRVSPVHLFY